MNREIQKLKTMGIVTNVHECKWFKINTKNMRKTFSDGAKFWNIITVRYAVDGRIYTTKKIVTPFDFCPKENADIGIWYDKANPKKIFLSA